MTYQELLNIGVEALSKHGLEDADFDARQLLYKVSSFDANAFLLNKGNEVSEAQIDYYTNCIEERMRGTPLQYILGQWEFFGYPFLVGPGVLIPRPETELLVQMAVDFIQMQPNTEDRTWRILDLCAGTGCIGISVLKQVPNATATFVEKSRDAFSYLMRNVELNGVADRATLILGDMTDGMNTLGVMSPDVLLSNPPYVKSWEMSTLQPEVQKEPAMALDGGTDGMYFFQSILRRWVPNLLPNTFIGLEGGEDQADQIADLLQKQVKTVSTCRDIYGVKRFVFGTK